MLTPEDITKMDAITGLKTPTTPQGSVSPVANSRVQELHNLRNNTIQSMQQENKPNLESNPNPLSEGMGIISDTVKNTVGIYKNAASDFLSNYINPQTGNNASTIKDPLLNLAQNSAGGAMSLMKTIFAPVVGLTEATTSNIAKSIGTNTDLQKNPTIGKIADFIQGSSDQLNKLSTTHPEVARGLSDGLQILAMLAGGGGGEEVGSIEGMKNIPSDMVQGTKDVTGKIIDTTGDLYKAITTKSPEQIDKSVWDRFEKGVRPSVSGKGTDTQFQNYKGNAIDAVKTITQNKDNLKIFNADGEETGKLPRTLNEFSQSIDQTKKIIYEKYNTLQKQAGQNGAVVDLKPVASELEKIASDPTLQDMQPGAVKYAKQMADTFEKRGNYTTDQTQTAIERYNKSLDAYYKNPSYNNATKASIDAMIANNMRKGLDSVIESAPDGMGYQDLKNQYASLKTIEKDVVHRAIVDGRKNAKGLLDFSDVLSAGEVIKGLGSMNPSEIVSGAAMKGVAKYYKYLNDPNTSVAKMFNISEKTQALK